MPWPILGRGCWRAIFADAANVADMDGICKGLGFKYPLAGVCFVILLISLTGLPLTAGFYGGALAFSATYQVYQNGQQYMDAFTYDNGRCDYGRFSILLY